MATPPPTRATTSRPHQHLSPRRTHLRLVTTAATDTLARRTHKRWRDIAQPDEVAGPVAHHYELADAVSARDARPAECGAPQADPRYYSRLSLRANGNSGRLAGFCGPKKVGDRQGAAICSPASTRGAASSSATFSSPARCAKRWIRSPRLRRDRCRSITDDAYTDSTRPCQTTP
jgi:hypothetical protein